MKRLYKLTICVVADLDLPEFDDRSPDAVIAEKWLRNEDVYADFGTFEALTMGENGIPKWVDAEGPEVGG